MIFKFSWTNKKDGDDIYAEHVNSLADGIKETQEAVENISIDIDTEMSDTSTNAVQNKVVKTYIDESVGDINTALDSIIAIQNNLMGVSE